METPKPKMAHFFLLKSENAEKTPIYAQCWNNGIVKDVISISYWPEICYRSLNVLDVLKLKVLIEVLNNFANKYVWTIVEYDMIFDQISVNTPKEVVVYEDYLKGEGFLPTEEQNAILEQYRQEVIENYGKE